MHARAISNVRPIESVRVFSPTAKNREAFASELGVELGVSITPVVSAEAAVDGATIICAAARSHDETPILLGKWLKPGVLTVSIGSTLPEQFEIDVEVVRRADLIVCDVPEEVVEETGDMLAAVKAGVHVEDKVISLNQLMSGQAPGRLETRASADVQVDRCRHPGPCRRRTRVREGARR